MADGHADSPDEYGMGLCRRMCKLLRVQGEIVVIDKVASAGGARMRGNGVVFRPATPMQPRRELNRFALAITPARSRYGFCFLWSRRETSLPEVWQGDCFMVY